ncbi:hypothetical protein C1645_815801 [Glomus cerebriforme]|uniref:Uncharacterized protein n=1 Tax=Glomus cerebriforme TaxID=658196 RepID=A0A397TD57_9GLOM|nr:hypothetical protein C1645_815801 [Glomus cerebriforme]
MDDKSAGSFQELRWFKIINGIPGLFAISVTLIFIVTVVVIFIIRILRPDDHYEYRKQVKEYFTDLLADKNRSHHTRVTKTIVFIFLAAGLLGLTIYNVDKMINDDPLISSKLEDNTLSPSFLFCPSSADNELSFRTALYSITLDDNERPINLTIPLNEINGENGKCLLFDGRNSLKPKDAIGGFYSFEFSQLTSQNVSPAEFLVFIGDTNNEMNWRGAVQNPETQNPDRLKSRHSKSRQVQNSETQNPDRVKIPTVSGFRTIPNWRTTMPEGNKFSNVAVQSIIGFGVVQYTETRYKILNGGYTFRSFQCSLIRRIDPILLNNNTTSIIGITIFIPKNVLILTEEPSLTLADLYSNVGGYLTIFGIFGFLFGSGKVNPFGFVSLFVFKEQEKANLEKDITTSNNINDQAEFEVEFNQLKNEVNQIKEFKDNMESYYVDMEFLKKK